MRHGHFPRVHWGAFDNYQNMQIITGMIESFFIVMAIMIPIIYVINYGFPTLKRKK